MIQASKDFHRLRANESQVVAALYQWETLLFACLKDGREVYNGFCLKAILRLAFHLSKGVLFAFRASNRTTIYGGLLKRKIIFRYTTAWKEILQSNLFIWRQILRYLFNFISIPSSPLFFKLNLVKLVEFKDKIFFHKH